MTEHIKNVAIVGASGSIGGFITDALLQTGKHNVTAITRRGGSATFPDGVQSKYVDYDDTNSLVEALRGQDCLIITLGVFAPPDTQQKLLDAAIAAGVAWFMPNEYGSIGGDDEFTHSVGYLAPKVAFRKKIEESGKIKWIGLATAFWYEYGLAGTAVRFGFDLEKRTVTFYNEGKDLIEATTWPQCGRAVAHLLSLPVRKEREDATGACLDQFANQCVAVESFYVSQHDMLDSILRVKGQKLEDWTITYQPAKERFEEGMKRWQAGDRYGLGQAMYARSFYSDGSAGLRRYGSIANESLGLPKEDLDEATKRMFDWIAKGKLVTGQY